MMLHCYSIIFYIFYISRINSHGKRKIRGVFLTSFRQGVKSSGFKNDYWNLIKKILKINKLTKFFYYFFLNYFYTWLMVNQSLCSVKNNVYILNCQCHEIFRHFFNPWTLTPDNRQNWFCWKSRFLSDIQILSLKNSTPSRVSLRGVKFFFIS